MKRNYHRLFKISKGKIFREIKEKWRVMKCCIWIWIRRRWNENFSFVVRLKPRWECNKSSAWIALKTEKRFKNLRQLTPTDIWLSCLQGSIAWWSWKSSKIALMSIDWADTRNKNTKTTSSQVEDKQREPNSMPPENTRFFFPSIFNTFIDPLLSLCGKVNLLCMWKLSLNGSLIPEKVIQPEWTLETKINLIVWTQRKLLNSETCKS